MHRRPGLVGVLAIACAAALAACSTAPSAGPTPKHTPTPAVTQHPLPAASDIPNNVAQRKYVSLTACRETHGGWAATGVATNPGPGATDYAITIFFTSTSATVLDYATTSVSVGAGGHATWRAEAQFAAPSRVLCVLRGVG